MELGRMKGVWEAEMRSRRECNKEEWRREVEFP